jgi:DNA/RNA endonuclease G (NUC1)|tara:strand:- start:93 stop:644 length:552 start_codon:yes stop_codon:yes gene_type:complete
MLLFGQGDKPIRIKTDIFTVVYSEVYEQPLQVNYKVLCPSGDADRGGMDFHKVEGVKTSDNHDYKDNPYDKGHLAPAAAFKCDKETLRKTFSYLNCALQHSGLNRGPWKELERFERNLAKVYENIDVVIYVHFENEPEYVKGGALIPSGFTKVISINNERMWKFTFDNIDLAGRDWGDFQVPL